MEANFKSGNISSVAALCINLTEIPFPDKYLDDHNYSYIFYHYLKSATTYTYHFS